MRRFTPREIARLVWLVEEGHSVRSATPLFLDRSEPSIARKAAELGLSWKAECEGEKISFRIPFEVFDLLRQCGRGLRMSPQRVAYIALVKTCRLNMLANLLDLQRDGGKVFDWDEIQQEAEKAIAAKAAAIAAMEEAKKQKIADKAAAKIAEVETMKRVRDRRRVEQRAVIDLHWIGKPKKPKIPYAGKDENDTTQW